MATLTNVNPRNPNEEDDEKNVSGPNSSMISGGSAPQSNPQGPASGGVQQGTPASGRFTNLNQYMKSNKQAGTNLGQKVGQNVGQAVNKATTGATQAQEGFKTGLATGEQEVGKIKDYTTKLGEKQEAPANTPENGLLSTQVGPADLASGYQANLGNRANYAQQLAGDQDALNTFLGYRSGQVAADQQRALQEQENQAKTATDKAGQTFLEKQQQLGSANKRGELLSDVAKSRTYTTGQQSLDNAFLQMDKNNTLAYLRKDLQGQQQQFNAGSMLPKLSEQFGTLRTNLGDATSGLQQQTEQNLSDLGADISSRQQAMVDARNARAEDLKKQYENFAQGKEVSKEFADLIGAQSGQRLFGVPNNTQMESFINTSGLQAAPSGQSDMANQQDVDLYSAFARLAETNPAVIQASQLAKEEGIGNFGGAVDAAKQNALNRVMNRDYGDGNRLNAFAANDIINRIMNNNALTQDAAAQEYANYMNERGARYDVGSVYESYPAMQLLNTLANEGFFTTANVKKSEGQ